jgi:hypothetical protein
LIIRSTIGISRKRPGPFGSGSSRPSRKTMPHDRRREEEQQHYTTMMIPMIAPVIP